MKKGWIGVLAFIILAECVCTRKDILDFDDGDMEELFRQWEVCLESWALQTTQYRLTIFRRMMMKVKPRKEKNIKVLLVCLNAK